MTTTATNVVYYCSECGGDSFEMRGERRCYAPLTRELQIDGWNEADPDWIEWDTDNNGEEIIYCNTCDSEWTREQLAQHDPTCTDCEHDCSWTRVPPPLGAPFCSVCDDHHEAAPEEEA